MGLILSPEPTITSGSSLQITVTKTTDIESYVVTTDGTPPVLAKYIAYDNLVPQNPFIATVEDGLGKVLMDGGFPKWYNDNCSDSWTTYSDLSPSYKYLFDAIDFISNKNKVNAGNKKILVLGDVESTSNYSIKDAGSGRGGFQKSINKVCSIKEYTPTYKTPSDYSGEVLDSTFAELDQYCCILFFSTAWTSSKLISDACISNLVTYRQSGNGIFFITDHGDRDIPDLTYARTESYGGFYRTANFVVTNFGCWFSGDYDRSPVNVGFLRTNYGNHPLWANLVDTDYISAGGSESRIFVTSFPLNYGSIDLSLTTSGYHPVQFLVRYTDGSTQLIGYTYGLNVPEIIFPMTDQQQQFTNSVIQTVKDTFYVNFKVSYSQDCSGLIKVNTLVVGNFTYTKATDTTTININSKYLVILYQAIARNINVKNNNSIYIQIVSPISYTKTLTIDFPVITFDDLRFSKYLAKGYVREFTSPNYSNSEYRNFKHMILNKDLKWWLPFPDLRFKANIFRKYFEKANGNSGATNYIITPQGGNQSGSQSIFKTYNFGTEAINKQIQISFNFIEIMTWNGEYFNVYGNDSIIAQKRYWVDSIYGDLDGDGITNSLSKNTTWPDEVHKFVLTTTTDNFGKFKLGFGSTLDEPITDESFSIDDIKMYVRYSEENFENSSDGWNIGIWDSQGESKLLGLMPGSNGMQDYSKIYSFGINNANRKVRVQLTFYKVDSWDGEYFIIFVNDSIVYKKSFVGTSYGNSDPSETGIKVYMNADNTTWEFDEKFNLSFEAQCDENGNFKLGFGNTLDQAVTDESTAVDNIQIDLIFTEDFESGKNGWNTDTTGYELSI